MFILHYYLYYWYYYTNNLPQKKEGAWYQLTPMMAALASKSQALA